jgi:tRNA (guanosine-2'-O-)-methyltransferase
MSTDLHLSPSLVVGCLAPLISQRRKNRIERVIQSRLGSVTVVLERLFDPHNGAAVLRTCEAMGLVHVHVVPDPRTPFRFSRKVSRNAHKWLNVYLHPTIDQCLGYLRQHGFICWAAMPPARDSHSIFSRDVGDENISVDCPTALVFGNEHDGLSQGALANCQRRFSIPLQGFSESLNLSVSVAVSLKTVVDRRRQALCLPGDLSDEIQTRLRAGYYALSTPHAASVVWRRLQESRNS